MQEKGRKKRSSTVEENSNLPLLPARRKKLSTLYVNTPYRRRQERKKKKEKDCQRSRKKVHSGPQAIHRRACGVVVKREKLGGVCRIIPSNSEKH